MMGGAGIKQDERGKLSPSRNYSKPSASVETAKDQDSYWYNMTQYYHIVLSEGIIFSLDLLGSSCYYWAMEELIRKSSNANG